MVKKIIAASAVAATVLMLAGGAMARMRDMRRYDPRKTDGGETRYEGSVENNNVAAFANTGLNAQRGGSDQDMKTGKAEAYATQENYVNMTDCGCARGRRGGDTTYEGEVEDNNVVAVANTGFNFQVGGDSKQTEVRRDKKDRRGGDRHDEESSQVMTTGNAYADAWQVNYVNSTMSPAN